MSNRLILAFASLALTLPATALSAVPAADQPPSVAIRYGDLNLANEAGVARLRSRVQAAANMVCGIYDARSLAAKRHAVECRRDALARANPQLELALKGGNGQVYAQVTNRGDQTSWSAAGGTAIPAPIAR